jgi:hypothetical protein
MRIYTLVWRTPAYFIYDPEREQLDGFRLDADRREYVALSPDAAGDLPVAPLGLRLGLRRTRYRDYDQPFVRWIDSGGNPLPIAQERVEELQARLRALEATKP